MSYLTHIENNKGAHLDPGTPHSAPPADGLRARYDLDRLRREVTRESIARGPASLWRYAPLLPVALPENVFRSMKAGRHCCRRRDSPARLA